MGEINPIVYDGKSAEKHARNNPVSNQLFEEARQASSVGDLERARILCNKLLAQLDVRPVGVIELLCQIEHDSGRYEVALQHAAALVATRPGNLAYRANQAALLGLLGNFEAAAGQYQQILAMDPDHEQANLNLGSAYLRMSHAWDAVQQLSLVVKKFPALPDASFLFAKAMIALGDYQGALPEIERGHRLAPGDLEIAMLFADVKATTGDVEGAIALFRQLLTLHPEHSARINMALGNAYSYRGDSARAIACLQECLEIDPRRFAAARSLTLLTKLDPDSPLAKQLVTQFRDGTLSNLQRGQIAYALAKIYEGSNAFDQAAAYYRTGNRALRASLAEDKNVSELGVYRRNFDIARSVTRQNFAVAGDDPTGKVPTIDMALTPIFIVGMPRSGSTMTEQIISAHSTVSSAGEVAYFSAAFSAFVNERHGDKQVPMPAENIAASLHALADSYARQISAHQQGADHVTDKWLYNFLVVGLIRKIFPHAKIVWCVRDYRDCAVSIFNTYFARGHWYATGFDDIAALYALHEEALEYWQQALPGQFYVQSYESMVASPETQVPRLLEYCGLTMEEACLNFHLRDNSVLTASMAQVRKPINTNSVARWQRFSRYQPELDNALKRHGILDG